MSRFYNWLTIVSLVIGANGVTLAAAEPVSFCDDIARVLLDHCLACHGEKKAEGGYRVDTFALLAGDQGDSGSSGLVAGELEESEVYRRIASDDVDERMPLGGEPLPQEFVARLQQWIEAGATFDGTSPQAPLASYAPLMHPDPPEHYPLTMPIAAIELSRDGSEIFVGGYYEITVWSATDGKLVRRFKNASQRTNAMDLSADGKTLAVGGGTPGKRGTVRLFDTDSGELKKVFDPRADMVLDLQWSPEGSRLAAGTAESLLLVYALESDAKPRAIAGHSDWVTTVAWSPDGKHLGSGSRDRTVKLFDVENGELLITYSKHEKSVGGVAFHPGGAEVFSAGVDNQVHRWKADDGKKLSDVTLGDRVNRLPLIGPYLFAASADRTVRQYDAKSFAEVRKYTGHQDWALTVAFHEATQRVVSGGFNGEVIVWNADDGSEICRFLAAPGYESVNAHEHDPSDQATKVTQIPQ